MFDCLQGCSRTINIYAVSTLTEDDWQVLVKSTAQVIAIGILMVGKIELNFTYNRLQTLF